MAWLNTHPIGPDGKPSTVIRMAQIERDGGRVRIPDVAAAYLITHLQSVGLFSAGGMSAAPLTSTELMAWQAGTGIQLYPWEFRAMLAASQAYVRQLHALGDQPPIPGYVQTSNPQTINKRLAHMQAALCAPTGRRK